MKRVLWLCLVLAACGGASTDSKVVGNRIARSDGNYDIEIVPDTAHHTVCYIYPSYGISCAATP